MEQEPKPGTLHYEISQAERLRTAVRIAREKGCYRDAALAQNELDRYRWKLRNRGWKSLHNQA